VADSDALGRARPIGARPTSLESRRAGTRRLHIRLYGSTGGGEPNGGCTTPFDRGEC